MHEAMYVSSKLGYDSRLHQSIFHETPCYSKRKTVSRVGAEVVPKKPRGSMLATPVRTRPKHTLCHTCC